jgi:hypothetical protein
MPFSLVLPSRRAGSPIEVAENPDFAGASYNAPMSWITNDKVAKQLLLEAATCKYIDSRRLTTLLVCLSFDDAFICTDGFAELLQRILRWSNDHEAHYMVLKPDPVWYFHKHFSKYPIVAIRSGETTEEYLASLHQDPGGSPADAVGTNCYEWVILPTSHQWFVHCLRDSSDKGGHLWIPQSWLEQTKDAFPWLTYPAEAEAADF